jgi:hypothetical protein
MNRQSGGRYRFIATGRIPLFDGISFPSTSTDRFTGNFIPK